MIIWDDNSSRVPPGKPAGILAARVPVACCVTFAYTDAAYQFSKGVLTQTSFQALAPARNPSGQVQRVQHHLHTGACGVQRKLPHAKSGWRHDEPEKNLTGAR